uniref:Uncharacterized protein n=1 Tax=Cannabis sativa TaxID=3483 RepID=A0A803PMJ5_CANSA
MLANVDSSGIAILCHISLEWLLGWFPNSVLGWLQGKHPSEVPSRNSHLISLIGRTGVVLSSISTTSRWNSWFKSITGKTKRKERPSN